MHSTSEQKNLPIGYKLRTVAQGGVKYKIMINQMASFAGFIP